jgi:hypothetical protein
MSVALMRASVIAIAVGAVAEALDVAPLHLQQARMHVRVGDVDVGAEQALVGRLRIAVMPFAMPERVVGIEGDVGDHARTSFNAASSTVASVGRIRFAAPASGV